MLTRLVNSSPVLLPVWTKSSDVVSVFHYHLPPLSLINQTCKPHFHFLLLTNSEQSNAYCVVHVFFKWKKHLTPIKVYTLTQLKLSFYYTKHHYFFGERVSEPTKPLSLSFFNFFLNNPFFLFIILKFLFLHFCRLPFS